MLTAFLSFIKIIHRLWNQSKATAFDKDSWTPHSKKKYPLQTEIYFNFNMHFVLRGLPEN